METRYIEKKVSFVMFMYQSLLMTLVSPPFCVLKNWAFSRDSCRKLNTYLLKIPASSFYCFSAIYNSYYYLIVLFAVLHSSCWSVARACVLLRATSIN